VATVIVAALGLAVIAWMLTWGNAGAGGDAGAGENGPDAALSAPIPEREPTPFFASYRSLQLRLPIDPDDLTALAFHQASGAAALSMTALVPDADMTLAAELKAVPPITTAADLPSSIWTGSCLRLWRSNRTGEPNTAADLGADPGTAVWSPVTGTVVEVKAYQLYGRHDDVEIHIRPDGWDDVDVVLIHVTDPVVETGDRVLAGATRLASVRKMSDKINMQLGGYTANGGDHVHVQLNKVEIPGVLPEPEES
jgi:murein DD-endopeptidase MepM/ murein hydrolase activator NlpD